MVEKEKKERKKEQAEKTPPEDRYTACKIKKYRSFMPICFAHSNDCYTLISNLDLVKMLLFFCVPIFLKDCD